MSLRENTRPRRKRADDRVAPVAVLGLPPSSLRAADRSPFRRPWSRRYATSPEGRATDINRNTKDSRPCRSPSRAGQVFLPPRRMRPAASCGSPPAPPAAARRRDARLFADVLLRAALLRPSRRRARHRAVFWADDASAADRVWSSDGTTAGTQILLPASPRLGERPHLHRRRLRRTSSPRTGIPAALADGATRDLLDRRHARRHAPGAGRAPRHGIRPPRRRRLLRHRPRRRPGIGASTASTRATRPAPAPSNLRPTASRSTPRSFRWGTPCCSTVRRPPPPAASGGPTARRPAPANSRTSRSRRTARPPYARLSNGRIILLVGSCMRRLFALNTGRHVAPIGGTSRRTS